MVARKELSSYSQLLHQDVLYLDPLKSPPVYYDLQPVSQGLVDVMPVYTRMGVDYAEQADSTHHHHHHPKKRKAAPPPPPPSSYNGGSDVDDDTGDDAKSVRTDDNKKQNHSEIEKRRRDKMNTYITELSGMVPMCGAMSRKLDKLTVLRMAVQHLKSIRGSVHSYTEGNYKPPFVSDVQLKQLILQAAEGFLFVVGCDRGRILYVSESVSLALNYTQGDLLGQSWFDILHPKDVAKVKEQLTSSDLSPRQTLIDAKTMLPVKAEMPHGASRLCPGARRSFFCRMKCNISANTIKEEADTTTPCHRKKKHHSSVGDVADRRFRVIQCTGYLKSWPPAKIGLEEKEVDSEGETCSLSCLVAVGRVQTAPIQPAVPPQGKPRVSALQFISRHAVDGKFLFVDQRATLVLGYLPQELLGTSMYEYFCPEDITRLASSHKAALQTSEPIMTQVYRFRGRDGNFVHIQSEWKAFKNPWTKEIEYIVAKNSRIHCEGPAQVESSMSRSGEGPSQSRDFDFFNNGSDDCASRGNGPPMTGREMTRLIASQVEMSSIGRKIADQVMMDQQRRCGDSPSSHSTPSPSHPDTMPRLSRNIFHDRVLSGGNGGNGNSGNGGVSGNTQREQDSTNHKQLSITQYNPVRNNVTLSSVGGNNNEGEGEEVIEMLTGSGPDEEASPSDGNDEAAMAVIMSLLEADAGLGGPVDFTGLPWPLP